MRLSLRFLSCLLLLSVFACQEVEPLPAPSEFPTAEPAATTVGHRVPGFLPAEKLPASYWGPAKADQASDYRAAHPQWYAITEPPPAGVRPMKEWEPMQAMILTFSDYMPSDAPVFQTFVDIIKAGLEAGEIWIVVDANSAKTQLINKLKSNGVTQEEIDEKIVFYRYPNNAIWMIDFGPLPIVSADNKVAFSDFRYYPNRYLDDAIPTRLGNAIGVTTYRAEVSLEGGNFQADGEKYCYTTTRELIYTGLTEAELETIFQEQFGCKEIVVVYDISGPPYHNEGIADGTGHIDMFFKLAGKHVAILGEYAPGVDDFNKQRMDDNQEILESLTYDDTDEGITVYRLPMPSIADNGTLPRTYINSTLFVSADESVKLNLWPMYTVDKDIEAEALAVWQEAMPDYEHIGIISDQISYYSGAVHCITRTIPALPFEKWIPDGTCEDGVCQNDQGGYTGACISQTEPTPGCWGPAWQCPCNDCSKCAVPDTCGNGHCDNGEDCANCIQDCPCGEGEACMGGQCVNDTCGDGTCDDTESCSTCVTDCGCTGGQVCSMGACVDSECGTITWEGCCDGSTAVYCEGGNLNMEDCGAEGCGWVAGENYYWCGGNGEDGSGNNPRDCHEFSYPRGCADKECGDNGGGYSCGECDEGLQCVDGKCVGCDPDCTDKVCGDDGCGGSCGTCNDGEDCVEGQCAAPCEDACAEGETGCEDGWSWTCEEVDGCWQKAQTACAEDEVCVDGACAPAEAADTTQPADDISGGGDEEDGGGGGSDCSTSGGPNSSAGLLVLLTILSLAAIRRRVFA